MTDEQFDPETIHSIEATAAEFTRIIESRNAALEAARAELSSETRWASQYHDEAEQLRALVRQADDRDYANGMRADLFFGSDTGEHMADEIEQLREAVSFNADQVTGVAHDNAMLRAENEQLREALGDALDYCDPEDYENGAAFVQRINALLAQNETGAQE